MNMNFFTTAIFLFLFNVIILAQQSSNKVLMVRPANFGYNNETASSNGFQKTSSLSPDSIQNRALREFDEVVKVLKSKGIETIILEDIKTPPKPDAIFPNNWISFHSDGRIFLYPMAAPNRRLERRQDFIGSLYKQYTVREIIDWSIYETDNQFLEGTGSIVFDRMNQMAFACLSPRTNSDLLNKLADKIEYKAIPFKAFDETKKAIYHTNVMMSIGTEFAVVCLESITNEEERNAVEDYLKNVNKEVIPISFQQMKKFAGNILELKKKDGKVIILMSQTAFNAFTGEQKAILSKYAEIVSVAIPTIENIGGGGIRCMITEMFLKK